MQIHFDTVEKKHKKTYYLIHILLGLCFVAFIISNYYDEGEASPRIRTIIITGVMLLIVLTATVRPFLVKEFVKLGQIQFSENSIRIVSHSKIKHYNLDEIKHLKFEINETSDDTPWIGSFIVKEGINNYIRFVDLHGDQQSYRIYISGISHLRILNRFLKTWKYQKFKLTGSRSITGY